MKLERIEDPWGDVWCHSDDVEKLEALNAELLEAAKALVERWDTPHWKLTEHTGVFIDRLRAAIAKADDPK